MPEFKHTSVLLPETVDSLNVVSGGTYIDCTAGGGGHSAAILEKLGPAGRLVCIDRDEDAVAVLEKRFSGDDRVTVVHGVFFCIRDIAGKLGLTVDELGLVGIKTDIPTENRPQLETLVMSGIDFFVEYAAGVVKGTISDSD